MDAQRRRHARSRMEARIGIPESAMGPLLRADGNVPDGDRITLASDTGIVVGGVEASSFRIRRIEIHQRQCTTLHSPVGSYLGGFSGEGRCTCRLFSKLGHGDRSSQAFLLEP